MSDKYDELIPTHIPTPNEIRVLRAQLNMSQEQLALKFNKSVRMIQRCEQGKGEMCPYVWEFINQIAKVIIKDKELTKPTSDANTKPDEFESEIDFDNLI